jgi:hypothetical protein
MKYRVYFRYDIERPPMAHKSDVMAFDKTDAEGVVQYRAATNGRSVVIIKSFKLEEYRESKKRHNGYKGNTFRRLQ